MSRPPSSVRLRAARLAADITQGQLADALGVEQSVISQAETGHRPPSPKRLALYLAAIEVAGVEVAAQKLAHGKSLELALAQVALADSDTWFPPRRVFPLRGKTPLVKWTRQATSDPRRVEALWRARSEADGVGWVVPDGFVIVDIDDPEAFLDLGLELPQGPMQTTTRGVHIAFAVDPQRTVRQGPIPGADLKLGGRGYVKIYSADAFTRVGTIARTLGPTSSGIQ